MPSIHLIERMNNLHRIQGCEDEWECGYWALSLDTATSLVGGNLYLHSRQTDPSHFGGQIISFRTQADGEYHGRIIFRFRFTHAHKGVKTAKSGWGNEKKLEP